MLKMSIIMKAKAKLMAVETGDYFLMALLIALPGSWLLAGNRERIDRQRGWLVAETIV